MELTKLGNQVVAVETGAEAVMKLEQSEFDVAVTDLKLPDFDGIEVIRRARQSGNDIPILVITAYASMKTAIAALQVGATDYLIKPVRIADLVRRLQQIDDLDRLQRENRLLRRVIQQDANSYWVAETPAGENIRRLVSKVGTTDLTVLISGESGTGKGVTARLLHAVSPRADGPFVSVNCGGIPEPLIESELFGYARGAFTGANRSHKGLFAAASGGTLFLDEIGSLAPHMQAKLLHATEEKSVRPVGSTTDQPLDLRIVAATNRDLEEMVQQGSFREDLFFRLSVFQLCLPSLREQREAIPAAVEYFLNKHAAQHPSSAIKIAPEVWDRFSAYDWPGNLRELENAIERALVLCEEGVITPVDLSPALQFAPGARPATAHGTLKERTTAFERLSILQTIEMLGGDRRRAADVLGIGLSTLYRKLDGDGPSSCGREHSQICESRAIRRSAYEAGE
jgi:two-component system response regulator AtoC